MTLEVKLLEVDDLKLERAKADAVHRHVLEERHIIDLQEEETWNRKCRELEVAVSTKANVAGMHSGNVRTETRERGCMVAEYIVNTMQVAMMTCFLPMNPASPWIPNNAKDQMPARNG